MIKVFPDKIVVLFILFLSYFTPPSPLLKLPATTTVIDHHHFNSSFSHSSFQELPFIRQEQQQTHFDPNEKYVTFFTHSGIQNQLIQVENGILLAWYLNRTLILPRAVLGKAFGWGPFERLHEQHTMRDKQIDCKTWNTNSPLKCPNKKKYTLVPFDQLFDLRFAKQHVKIITRDFSESDWLEKTLGIDDNDVLYFKGQTRYDWRIFDMPLKHKFLGKYSDSLEIDQLRSRDEKLIHFTSLFGTGKLPVRRPEHLAFLEKLGKSITYRHPAVLEMSERIVQALGGAGHFIGVHLRTSDGLFVNAIPENINKISKSIEQHVSPLAHELISSTHDRLSQCVNLAKSKQTTLVFLATDASHPQQYTQLYQTTPCIFTLHDILDDENPAWNSIMDQHRTSHTGESMRKYLIPLVDGLVSSRGHTFIGTEGSTFSGYVRRLHDTFWNN